MHYEEVGTGRPMLILHGGVIGNSAMARAAMEPAFAGRSGWRRIYPDQIGHGKTPLPAEMRGHDDVVDVVLAFLDSVAPGERFALVGWSWGGYIARGVLHRRLKQIDGVMLYVPLVTWKRDLPAKSVVASEPKFAGALKTGEEWLADLLTVQSLAVLQEARANLAAHAVEMAPGSSAVLDANLFSYNPDSLPELCLAPALIVTGRQDNIEGYKQAWSILDNFPRGTYAVLDRAGHLLGLEQPKLFKALANEWLDRVEEYCA